MQIEKKCTTCYHNHHNKHTVAVCRHALMCHEHDKWIPCTNGDYIRQMNNEDLAGFLCDISENGGETGCLSCIATTLCSMKSNGMTKWVGEPIDREVFGEWDCKP